MARDEARGDWINGRVAIAALGIGAHPENPGAMEEVERTEDFCFLKGFVEIDLFFQSLVKGLERDGDRGRTLGAQGESIEKGLETDALGDFFQAENRRGTGLEINHPASAAGEVAALGSGGGQARLEQNEIESTGQGEVVVGGTGERDAKIGREAELGEGLPLEQMGSKRFAEAEGLCLGIGPDEIPPGTEIDAGGTGTFADAMGLAFGGVVEQRGKIADRVALATGFQAGHEPAMDPSPDGTRPGERSFGPGRDADDIRQPDGGGMVPSVFPSFAGKLDGAGGRFGISEFVVAEGTGLVATGIVGEARRSNLGEVV